MKSSDLKKFKGVGDKADVQKQMNKDRKLGIEKDN